MMLPCSPQASPRRGAKRQRRGKRENENEKDPPNPRMRPNGEPPKYWGPPLSMGARK